MQRGQYFLELFQLPPLSKVIQNIYYMSAARKSEKSEKRCFRSSTPTTSTNQNPLRVQFPWTLAQLLCITAGMSARGHRFALELSLSCYFATLRIVQKS